MPKLKNIVEWVIGYLEKKDSDLADKLADALRKVAKDLERAEKAKGRQEKTARKLDRMNEDRARHGTWRAGEGDDRKPVEIFVPKPKAPPTAEKKEPKKKLKPEPQKPELITTPVAVEPVAPIAPKKPTAPSYVPGAIPDHLKARVLSPEVPPPITIAANDGGLIDARRQAPKQPLAQVSAALNSLTEAELSEFFSYVSTDPAEKVEQFKAQRDAFVGLANNSEAINEAILNGLRAARNSLNDVREEVHQSLKEEPETLSEFKNSSVVQKMNFVINTADAAIKQLSAKFR